MPNPVKVTLDILSREEITCGEAAEHIVAFLIPEPHDGATTEELLDRQQAQVYLEQLLASRTVFDPTSLVVHLRALMNEPFQSRDALGRFAQKFLDASGCKYWDSCQNATRC